MVIRKTLLIPTAAALLLASGCSKTAIEKKDPTEIQVFIAASLNSSMQDIAEEYQKDNPQIKIVLNADSSGKLLTQIEEGYACDLFFSAAAKQVNSLEADGLMIEGSRADLLKNQLVVVKRKDTESRVEGLKTLGEASNIALADGSVPAGRYTRLAMIGLGMLPETEDASSYTTAELSAILGTEISEQGNVSQVLLAVKEGSCEVGTTYYSDLYGYEDELEVIEFVDSELTGPVIYPACLVKNGEAGKEEKEAAAAFLEYLKGDAASEVFEAHFFHTDKGE